MPIEMIIFMGIFFWLIFIPCAGIAWIGKKLIDRIGRYPSRTPALQTQVIFKLTVIEVVSLTLLLGFFKVLVTD